MFYADKAIHTPIDFDNVYPTHSQELYTIKKERVDFSTLSILLNLLKHYFMLFFLYKDSHEPYNALHPQTLPQFYYAPSLQSHENLPMSKKHLH